MDDRYERGQHAKYMMQAHLIFVCNYRKRLLVKSFNEDVKQWLNDAAAKKNCSIIRMETDRDHVHMLVRYPVDMAVSKLAGWLKQYSTYQAWQKYGAMLSHQFWKKKILWSDGYFACSIGQVSQATIEKYIRNQG